MFHASRSSVVMFITASGQELSLSLSFYLFCGQKLSYVHSLCENSDVKALEHGAEPNVSEKCEMHLSTQTLIFAFKFGLKDALG